MKKIISITILIFLFFLNPVHAASVKLAWDANVEEDLAGYKIYWGYASRFDTWLINSIAEKDPRCSEEDPLCCSNSYQYNTVADVGNVLTFAVENLSDATNVFFAATAYDADGNESFFSKEVSHRIDTTAPDIVINFSSVLINEESYKITIEKVLE